MLFDRRDTRFFLIAGPCAIENQETVMETAGTLKEVCGRLGIDLIFKSSFDKLPDKIFDINAVPGSLIEY